MKRREPTKHESLIGWIVLLIGVAIIVAVLSDLSSATECQVCRNPLLAKQTLVAKQIIAPAYPIGYQVGQAVRMEAMGTQYMRQSDEYQELLQLRGYRAGVEAATAGRAEHVNQAPAPLNRWLEPESSQEPSSEGLPAPPSDQPSETQAPPPGGFAARYPTLASTCSKCHSGDNPKGDFLLDETTRLDGPDADWKRDAIAAAVINDRMPKGKPLDDQTKYNILVEVFSE